MNRQGPRAVPSGDLSVIRLVHHWQGPRNWVVLILLSAGLLALISAGATLASWHLAAWQDYRAAMQAIERRDFAEARARLERCLAVWPHSAEVHLLAARTARRAGAYDDAEKHLKECQRLDWPMEEVRLERDLIRAQRGDVSDVEKHLMFFAEHGHPDALLILEALCQGYLKTYRLTHASRCLELWLQKRPDDVQALLWRAEVAQLRSSNQEALADCRRAVELAPEHDKARLRLAQLLVTENLPAEAIPHFERLRQRQPENTEVLLGLARCRRLLGEPEEAGQLLDQLLQITPEDVGALGERGRVCLEKREPARAERWLRMAVNRAPYDRDMVYALYLCLQQSGKAQEAEEYRANLKEIESQLNRLREVTRRITETPHDPALRHEAGVIFLKSGQNKEGLRWLYSALQEEPGYQPTHQVLADYYEKTGDKEKAIWHRRQAEKLRVMN
jgi:tetratricopeptide (TPR) repeat protein